MCVHMVHTWCTHGVQHMVHTMCAPHGAHHVCTMCVPCDMVHTWRTCVLTIITASPVPLALIGSMSPWVLPERTLGTSQSGSTQGDIDPISATGYGPSGPS